MAVLSLYFIVDLSILLALLLTGFYLYMRRNFNYWKKRGVEQLTPILFFGNFGEIVMQRKSFGKFVKDTYNSYKGSRYVGFYIFDDPHLLILEPELVKHIFVKDFHYFSDKHASPDPNDRLGASNLFMIKNPAWKIVRKKLSPIYTSGKLKNLFQLLVVIGRNIDKHLEQMHLEGAGKVMEMKELTAKITTDMIATTAYGLQANSLENPQAEFRKYGRKIFEFSGWRGIEFMVIFFYPKLVKLIRAKFFGKEATEFLRSVFWDTLECRIQSKEKRNDLIDMLIELRENNKGQVFHGFSKFLQSFRFEGDDLLSQAAVFFTGGFETSAGTTSFTLYELAMNSKIQAKIRDEIHNALAETDGHVTYDMINKLPYMEMAIAETLRKYPPLPFLDRVVSADYKVPGSDLVLEKGRVVNLPMLGFHYDPEYYPDPEKYDPERFTEENKKSRPAFTYFPFGEGPHMCIGMRLGIIQTKLALLQILNKWEVVPCEQTPDPLVLDPKAVTTQALGGIHLTIRKITMSRVNAQSEPMEKIDDNQSIGQKTRTMKREREREREREMAITVSSFCIEMVIILFCLIVTIIGFLLKQKFNYWKRRGVPFIPPFRIYLNFFDWFLPRVSTGGIVRQLYEQSAGLPYVGLYIFERPVLMARDPEIIKHVLIKHSDIFDDRLVYSREADILGHANLFGLRNPAWKFLRSKMTPLFTSLKLKKIFELLQGVASDLDTHMTNRLIDDEASSLDMKEICAKYTTDAISASAFGTRANSLNNPDAEFRKYGGKLFDFQLWHGFEAKAITFSPSLVNLLKLSFFERSSTNFLRKVFWDIAKERETLNESRNDLLDLLMRLKKEYEANPGESIFRKLHSILQSIQAFPLSIAFQGDYLVAQAAIFFGAGYESSSSAMFFTLYELALQPELQAKLRNKITSAIQENGGKVTYEMVLSLDYLNMVLSETLRKYPALPVLDRVANEDYKIPGTDLTIEKGTAVLIPMLGLHYDPDYFPQPEKFDPERFSEGNLKTRPSTVYLPFGAGPRICIGVRLAHLQSKLGLIHLISRYEFSPNDKTMIPLEFDTKGHLTTTAKGLYLNVKRIKQL
ncbi:uncharacterized protein [Prorops nasuta]|uniref:uncharacterized protein n=1 Tax=Prorops nasuta TaxID=863751 RepID=UPI0034CE2EE5